MKTENSNKNLFDIEKLTNCYLEEIQFFEDIHFKTFCEFLKMNFSFLKIDIVNDRIELANIFNSVINEIIKKLENEKM